MLETIKNSGPISKTDISRLTQLNIVTVSNYITHFIKEGLVAERGLDISSGGRRPVLIELNPGYGYVIGLDLGRHEPFPIKIKMVGILADLSGNIIAKLIRTRHKERMDEMLGHAVDLVKDLVRKAGVKKEEIKGVGLGVSGVIDEPTGTVRCLLRDGDSGNYEFLMNRIEREFGFPAFIGNDATFAAYGEYSFRSETLMRNMLYMYSDVGCGFIVKGEIYCGATGCAGELTMNLPRSQDSSIHCGSAVDCILKPRDIGWMLTQEAIGVLTEETNKESRIKGIAGKLEDISFEVIIKAAEEGDKFSIELLRKGGELLGMKIAYLVNLFNPDMVIVGGSLEHAGAFILDPIKNVVSRWALPEAADAVKIVNSRLGGDAVAMGAASLVIRELFATL